jgi:energy-coupling factor transport system ATP-binding protein
VIVIEQLRYAYPPLVPEGEPIRVLRGIDLSVARGEFLSLMGPTGVGKSTLCMALNGLVPQATGGVISGRVRVLGRDPWRTPVAALAAQVGIIYQDPETQLFSTTVEDEVAFGPENLGLPPVEIAERVQWALNVVNMAAYRDRSPALLSGGQKQRVAIAATLAMLPEVLILDEPTANLDPVGQYEVFSVIEGLCRGRSMTIVMVSQDAEHVAQFSDRVAIMWQGQLALVDEPARVFADADLIGTVGVAAPQVSDLGRRLSAPGTRHRAWLHVHEAEAALRDERPTRHTAPVEPAAVAAAKATEPVESKEEIIRVRDLVFHYADGDDEDLPALNGVTLNIARNAFLAIVGQNGSGKTTLVKHFNGLLRPTGGEVWVNGVNTSAATVSELAHSVGYVFQNPDHQIFCATTRAEIGFGPRNLGLAEAEVQARTEDALAAFGLAPHADTPPAVLGYGLRRMVSLAAVYAMRPQVLILDEPTAGLDWRSATELMALVGRLHSQGHTIILVSHDMRLVAEFCPAMLVMHEGRLLASGPTREVFGRAADLAHAQLTPPQITRLSARLADLDMPPDVLTVDEFVRAWRSPSGAGGVP